MGLIEDLQADLEKEESKELENGKATSSGSSQKPLGTKEVNKD